MTQAISPPQPSELQETKSNTSSSSISGNETNSNKNNNNKISVEYDDSAIANNKKTTTSSQEASPSSPPQTYEESEQQFSHHHIMYRKVRVRLIPLLNLIFFIGLVIMNVISATGPIINGVRTQDISFEYFTSFTPKGWAFSIWGLIYTFIAIVVVLNVVQSLILGRDNILINHKISIFLTLNMLCNILWFFPWHFSARGNQPAQWVAAVGISLILITLIIMYVRVNVNYFEPSKRSDFSYGRFWNHLECNLWEFFIVQPMISIYMGWITVATILNITIAITSQWPSPVVAVGSAKTLWGWSQSSWACLLLGIVLCIALIFLSWRRDVAYAGVLCWATYAIYDEQNKDPIVASCAMLVASVIAFCMVCTILVTVKDYIQYHGGFKKTGQHIKKSFKNSFAFFFDGNWKHCARDQLV